VTCRLAVPRPVARSARGSPERWRRPGRRGHRLRSGVRPGPWRSDRSPRDLLQAPAQLRDACRPTWRLRLYRARVAQRSLMSPGFRWTPGNESHKHKARHDQGQIRAQLLSPPSSSGTPVQPCDDCATRLRCTWRSTSGSLCVPQCHTGSRHPSTCEGAGLGRLQKCTASAIVGLGDAPEASARRG
jgi:hypothetical protein